MTMNHNQLVVNLMRLGLFLFFMGLLSVMFGQKVYITDNQFIADYTVCPSSNQFEADLIIYITDNRYEAKEGMWFITDNRYDADFIVYISTNSYLSDYTIFQTNNKYLTNCDL